MTVLRTTRPDDRRTARVQWVVCVAALGVFGCGTVPPPPGEPPPGASPAATGTNDPNWLTSRPQLPAPDTDRIEYDAQKQTLSLYDLSGGDRWMVQLPNERVGRPVGPRHRLPEGVDTARTLVYYTRPGVKSSAPVTVAQIASGRPVHNSALAFRR